MMSNSVHAAGTLGSAFRRYRMTLYGGRNYVINKKFCTLITLEENILVVGLKFKHKSRYSWVLYCVITTRIE